MSYLLLLLLLLRVGLISLKTLNFLPESVRFRSEEESLAMDVEEAGSLAPPTRARHIGKRALKNKNVTVSFDEKGLRY